MIKLRDITRLEIHDEYGRGFSRYDLDGVSLETEDDGETLRISLDFEGEPANTTVTVLSAAANWLSQDEPNVEMALSAIRDHLDEILGGDDG